MGGGLLFLHMDSDMIGITFFFPNKKTLICFV